MNSFDSYVITQFSSLYKVTKVIKNLIIPAFEDTARKLNQKTILVINSTRFICFYDKQTNNNKCILIKNGILMSEMYRIFVNNIYCINYPFNFT